MSQTSELNCGSANLVFRLVMDCDHNGPVDFNYGIGGSPDDYPKKFRKGGEELIIEHSLINTHTPLDMTMKITRQRSI